MSEMIDYDIARPVAGYPVGKYLGVRYDDENEWWQIDHIPTGFRVCPVAGGKEAALKLADDINTTVPEKHLSSDDMETATQSFPADLLARMKVAAKG